MMIYDNCIMYDFSFVQEVTVWEVTKKLNINITEQRERIVFIIANDDINICISKSRN